MSAIKEQKSLYKICIQALRKEPLTVYGDGKQTRSFQFVSDLVLFSLFFLCFCLF